MSRSFYYTIKNTRKHRQVYFASKEVVFGHTIGPMCHANNVFFFGAVASAAISPADLRYANLNRPLLPCKLGSFDTQIGLF